jgi:hypothetical protein
VVGVYGDEDLSRRLFVSLVSDGVCCGEVLCYGGLEFPDGARAWRALSAEEDEDGVGLLET